MCVFFRELDREQTANYSFDVLATDSCLWGPRSRSVHVNINVLDVNDNPPIFTSLLYSTTVTPNITANIAILTVSATDRDTGLNSQISYGLLDPSSYFQVDPNSGVVTTKISLDSSVNGVYALRIMAVDNEVPHQNSTCEFFSAHLFFIYPFIIILSVLTIDISVS